VVVEELVEPLEGFQDMNYYYKVGVEEGYNHPDRLEDDHAAVGSTVAAQMAGKNTAEDRGDSNSWAQANRNSNLAMALT